MSLLLQLGKMNQILLCDWLLEWARLGYLACSGLPTVSRKKMVFFIPHTKSVIDQPYSVKKAEYCLNVVFFFMDLSLVCKMKKQKNWANIQPVKDTVR